MESWREELYHHGIAGQKWGQRNGPPYPLGYSDHSSAEKKKNPKSLISGATKNKVEEKTNDEITVKDFEKELKKEGFTRIAGYFAKKINLIDSDNKTISTGLLLDIDDLKEKSSNKIKREEFNNYKKTVNNIANNFSEYDKKFKDGCTDYAFEYTTPWSYDETNMTEKEMRKQFKKDITVSYITNINNNGGFILDYDDGGTFYGHGFQAEYDPKTKQFKYYNMYG